MTVNELLDALPSWSLLLSTLLITGVSIDLGYRLGKRRKEQLPAGETMRTAPVAAASFSLLAFILATTFGGVNSRLKDMKHVAVDEMNAIGTTFARADLLSAADRLEVRELLQSYVKLRIEAEQQLEEESAAQTIDRLTRLQNDLWSKAIAISGQGPTARLFLQSANRLIETNRKWTALKVYQRLPGRIWMVLYGLLILAMMMGGYDTGASESRRVIGATVIGALAFSVVLALLVALDRPSPRATQAAMINLQEEIRSSVQSGL